MSYGTDVTLEGVGQEQAIERVTEALASEGFGVLTRIDVRETLKKKLNVDFRPYAILGACNPVLAHRALEIDPKIGLLLPCNVVVRQGPGESTTVSIVDPGAMLSVAEGSAVRSVADEASERLKRVADSLSKA